MNSTKNPLAATVKAAGMAAALILGLTLSTGGAAAHVRTAGPDATPATHQAEQSCEKDQAVEKTLEAAAKQVQGAFVTNHLAIEQLRQQAGGRDTAARDLLKQADSQVKEIRATAMTALDALSESTAACTALDAAALDAIDALVAQATSDMEAVVTDVTASVAALPAPDPKVDVEDEDNDKDEDADEDADHETKSEDHETKTAEKSGDKPGERSTVQASMTSKGRSHR